MEEYEYLATLGEGAYGFVWKCVERATGRLVAIKGFKQAHEEPEIMRLAAREVRTLQSLRHPAITPLIDAFKTKTGRVFMVFPYIGRSAYQELDEHPDGLTGPRLKLLVWQLLQALVYLHQRKIIHRDIKPANILLSEDGAVKLCDFGFARTTRCGPRDVEEMSSYVVTRWYRAPEVLVGDQYGPSSDVWSLGCTISELASGRTLFPGKSTGEQLWRIMRCFGPLPASQAAALSSKPRLARVRVPLRGRQFHVRMRGIDPALLQLLESCLQLDPRRRPTAAELLQSQYFWGVPRLLAGTPLEQVYCSQQTRGSIIAGQQFEQQQLVVQGREREVQQQHRKQQQQRQQDGQIAPPRRGWTVTSLAPVPSPPPTPSDGLPNRGRQRHEPERLSQPKLQEEGSPRSSQYGGAGVTGVEQAAEEEDEKYSEATEDDEEDRSSNSSLAPMAPGDLGGKKRQPRIQRKEADPTDPPPPPPPLRHQQQQQGFVAQPAPFVAEGCKPHQQDALKAAGVAVSGEMQALRTLKTLGPDQLSGSGGAARTTNEAWPASSARQGAQSLPGRAGAGSATTETALAGSVDQLAAAGAPTVARLASDAATSLARPRMTPTHAPLPVQTLLQPPLSPPPPPPPLPQQLRHSSSDMAESASSDSGNIRPSTPPGTLSGGSGGDFRSAARRRADDDQKRLSSGASAACPLSPTERIRLDGSPGLSTRLTCDPVPSSLGFTASSLQTVTRGTTASSVHFRTATSSNLALCDTVMFDVCAKAPQDHTARRRAGPPARNPCGEGGQQKAGRGDAAAGAADGAEVLPGHATDLTSACAHALMPPNLCSNTRLQDEGLDSMLESMVSAAVQKLPCSTESENRPPLQSVPLSSAANDSELTMAQGLHRIGSTAATASTGVSAQAGTDPETLEPASQRDSSREELDAQEGFDLGSAAATAQQRRPMTDWETRVQLQGCTAGVPQTAPGAVRMNSADLQTPYSRRHQEMRAGPVRNTVAQLLQSLSSPSQEQQEQQQSRPISSRAGNSNHGSLSPRIGAGRGSSPTVVRHGGSGVPLAPTQQQQQQQQQQRPLGALGGCLSSGPSPGTARLMQAWMGMPEARDGTELGGPFSRAAPFAAALRRAETNESLFRVDDRSSPLRPAEGANASEGGRSDGLSVHNGTAPGAHLDSCTQNSHPSRRAMSSASTRIVPTRFVAVPAATFPLDAATAAAATAAATAAAASMTRSRLFTMVAGQGRNSASGSARDVPASPVLADRALEAISCVSSPVSRGLSLPLLVRPPLPSPRQMGASPLPSRRRPTSMDALASVTGGSNGMYDGMTRPGSAVGKQYGRGMTYEGVTVEGIAEDPSVKKKKGALTKLLGAFKKALSGTKKGGN